MQPGVAGTGEPANTSRTVSRLRALAVCVALTALAFLQDPGKIVADTKVDLVVDPAGFLQRSLHLWDPAGTFGQLQNQAYGYLWPMGPFFLAGSWLGMPAWAIQRLWWALLFCVAFTGLMKLAGRLGIGTPSARIIAGAAFALSPRILTDLGSNSVEVWPMAIAPWVIVPLVGLAGGARLRPAVTRSAIIVACAGGVNATAVLAIAPLAVIWLSMLRPLRRRLAALVSWCAAVVCAIAWWLVPLLFLGRYSPEFLAYTETAEVTTRVTDAVTVLRGASHWVAYLGSPFGPTWPAGWRIATQPMPVVATILLAALGVVGLSRRAIPHRRFLVTGLLAGAALVGLGHVSALDGTVSGLLRGFLDGLGAPLRNVHKFDVVLRLPLALGVAHLVGVLHRMAGVVRNGIRPMRVPALLASATVVAAVVGVATPALARGLPPPGGVDEVPGYWHEAANWLNSRQGTERVLIVPAAGFPYYQWGKTSDEIAQPLLDGPWAVRNLIPLTPEGTIRLLDAVETALSTGAGSAGLADLLARSGVGYVLLRSDVDYGRSGTTRPLIVRQALERSPGLSLVARFGPVTGRGRPVDTSFDRGMAVPVRALEVFRVQRDVDPVVAYDVDDITAVVGGPESLLSLAAAGQLGPAPTVLAGELPDRPSIGHLALTDGLRRRDVDFGRLHDNTSATLTAGDSSRDAPPRDYLPRWAKQYETTVRYHGVTRVDATSSWAQARVPAGSRPEHQPFAAIDGDLDTSWRPALGTFADGQWIEVELEKPQVTPEVRVHFDLAADSVPTQVTVTAGIERATVAAFGSSMDIRLPGVHATRTVRVTVDTALGVRAGFGNFGISEIEIPGLRAARTLVVPSSPATTEPASVVLAAAAATPSCFFVLDRPRCAPDAERASEDGDLIDRTIDVPTSGSYAASVWARPKIGPELNALLDQQVASVNAPDRWPTVVASSSAVADPAARPGAVLDGDPRTAWMSAATDGSPLLRMTWPAPRTVTGVALITSADVAATRVGAVQVIGDGGVRGGFLNDDGVVMFDKPLRTDEISILIHPQPAAHSYDPYSGWIEALPVAVSEVTVLPGRSAVKVDLDERVTLDCGSGPTLDIGGSRIETRIIATRRDLLQLREVQAQPCESGGDLRVSMSAGDMRVIASASSLTTPTRLALVPDQQRPRPSPSTIRVDNWAATQRRLRVSAHPVDRILAVRENANPAWRATASGQVLTPVVVDGWQQGWVLPAGISGEVVLRFVPDSAYRWALLAGAVLALVVLLLALIPPRRRGAHARRQVAVPRRGRKGLLAHLVGAGALILIGGPLGLLVVFAGTVALAYRSVPVSSISSGHDPRRVRRLLRVLESWVPAALVVVGGWLSLTVEGQHVAAGPQVAGVLAVAGLWLSEVVLPWRRRSDGPTLQRALEDVEADGGEQESAAYGYDIRAQELPGEGGPIGNDVDAFQDEEMPEEQPVRDLA